MNCYLKWKAGWIPATILAMASGGCGAPKALPSAQVAVEGEAAPTINRDAHGDPLSVVVRVYHLKDKAEFSRLTFDMATSGRPDEELLGPDFLGRSEVVVVPGNLFRKTMDLAPGTNYLGIVAFFRKPDPNHWRCLVSKEQLRMTHADRKAWQGRKLPLLAFKVQDCFLSLTTCRPEPIPGLPPNAKPECGGAATEAPGPQAVPARSVPQPATASSRPLPFPRQAPPGP